MIILHRGLPFELRLPHLPNEETARVLRKPEKEKISKRPLWKKSKGVSLLRKLLRHKQFVKADQALSKCVWERKEIIFKILTYKKWPQPSRDLPSVYAQLPSCSRTVWGEKIYKNPWTFALIFIPDTKHSAASFGEGFGQPSPKKTFIRNIGI